MAGGQAGRKRGGGHLAMLGVVFLALGGTAGAQVPAPASLDPPPDLGSIGDGNGITPRPPSRNTFFPADAFGGGGAPAANAPRVEMGLFDTITESLFGDVYAPGTWRPLPLSTFFSEGWFEPWAAAPAGRDGISPRHGWLAAFDGVFYRLWFATFSYANGINTPFGGSRYSGTYSIFLPFSRRFEVLIDVPFVISNGTRDPNRGYTSEFGDLSITPRFMLSETAATSQCFALGIRTPTGSLSTGTGIMALTPRYEFWTNPGGPWVVRGSAGFFVPMNKAEIPVQTAAVGGLAVGRYFTPHDVPFGDLVFYCESNFAVPLDGGAAQSTLVSVGPGTRFHIANDYYFLADWDFPVTGNRPAQYTFQVAILKVF
jgi:hypothetical protein